MLEEINLYNLLFIDIETVPQVYKYSDLDESTRLLWDKKVKFQVKEEQTPADLYEKSGIWAEFGKVICISIGTFVQVSGERKFIVKSFAGDDERTLLNEFINTLNMKFNEPQFLLCAHNGKEFDFPYLSRRILINGLKLPGLLNIAGKKPWELKHIDTMELWKFGDYKNYTSLELLAHIFNVPTPKDDIDGSQVAPVYYEENDLDRIVIYCQKDVITTARVLQRYKGDALFSDDDVLYR
jgi:predicted PolB exonuclease-like 3'-5' exonuclease